MRAKPLVDAKGVEDVLASVKLPYTFSFFKTCQADNTFSVVCAFCSLVVEGNRMRLQTHARRELFIKR